MLNNFDKISSDIDLFLENCDSLLILGIGNDIRGDDGLGPYIINQLSILKENLLGMKMVLIRERFISCITEMLTDINLRR